MKIRLIPLTVLLLVGIFLFTSWNKIPSLGKKKFHVSGLILLVSQNCGGVAPTLEMQQREKKPILQPRTTLYFRDGNSNYYSKQILDSVTSDSLGNFSIDLPPGTYCIIEKYKTNKFKYPEESKDVEWDTACYRKNFERCDFVLNVTEDIDSVNVVIARNCIWKNPCVKSYHGARPSSPAPGNKFPTGKEMVKPK